MSVSLEYLQRCAADTGYEVGALEKVVRLGELAGDIARHPLLGNVLSLKGGTAINLCFGPPSRLSVDLDYNYTGQLERNAMLVERPGIEAAVEELARRRGYAVQRSADTFAGRKLFLGFSSVLGPNDRIEVDLNFLFRLPLNGTTLMELWQPGELDRPRVRVVSAIELCVGKLLALLDRCAPRDAWDAVGLHEKFRDELGSAAFRAWFVALSGMLDHPVQTYGRDRLEARLTARVITEQLAPMLAADAEVHPAELLDRAWKVLQPLVRLSAGEAQYVEGIHRGEHHPELLCLGDARLAAEFDKHPAIQWKLVNVRRHRSKRSGSPAKNGATGETGD